MTTLDRSKFPSIAQFLDSRAKRVTHNEIHAPCPLCGGNDRFIYFTDSERWACRQCTGYGTGGKTFDVITLMMRQTGLSFTQTIKELGLVGDDGRYYASPTKGVTIRNLADYAKLQGAPVSAFAAAGWVETTHKNRAALGIPVGEQMQFRFTDGNNPKYIWRDEGSTRALYGFERAIALAKKQGETALVLCNGATSAVVAQYYGIPAFAQVGGEGRLTDDSLRTLMMAWKGKIMLAMDCDPAGANATQALAAQIGSRAQVIDLNMSEGGDLGSYCKLFAWDAWERLKSATAKGEPIVSMRDAALSVAAQLADGYNPIGRTLIMPYTSIAALDGYARYMMAGKVTLIIGGTGTGKTTFADNLISAWQARGYHGLLISPEFSAEEHTQRRLQAMSGGRINIGMIVGDRVWKEEALRGVPEEKRFGVAMSQADRQRAERILHTIETLEGQLFVLKPQAYIDDILKEAAERIEAERAREREVSYIVVDYIQLMKPRETGESPENGYIISMDKIKQFCIEYAIHGVIISQINKDASAAAKRGKFIGAEDAGWINPNMANLAISLNKRYDEAGNVLFVSDSIAGAVAGVVCVLKNNAGSSGDVNLIYVPYAYQWRDDTYTEETIKLSE